MVNSVLKAKYEEAKRQCSANFKSIRAGEAILRFAISSLKFLVNDCQEIDLVSRVPQKEYFTFKRGDVFARPANRQFFVANPAAIARLWKKWRAGTVTAKEFAELTYTVALSPCLAMEIFDRQNKKGPATFFEHYIGHLFSKAVGINPTKRVRLPVHGRDVLMTMDFLIDMGRKRRKLHLPVKMSTRERVVQAWAHQRLLDAAYGKASYQGIMVLFSETKLDSRSLEVVEICVPDQWLVYQSLLAHMDRIYYFDVPVRYKELTEQFPDVIAIKQFGEFFSEKAELLR